MEFKVSQYRLSDLKFQRNILTGTCALLLCSNLVQSLGLFFRHERVIITPPQLTQSFWVEGNQYSPQYLEEMALHYAHFLLDVTEKNILYQGDILLRYVAPESYGTFKAKLLADEKQLKQDHLSTRFSPLDVVVHPNHLAVDLTGELLSYVGDKKISQIKETYQIKFRNQSGKLLIENFVLINSSEKSSGNSREGND